MYVSNSCPSFIFHAAFMFLVLTKNHIYLYIFQLIYYH
ncbi:hypothetical protein OIU76_022905, partial [Salix suchowensis]